MRVHKIASILLNNIIHEIAMNTANNLPINTSSEIADNIASASNFINNIIREIANQYGQHSLSKFA